MIKIGVTGAAGFIGSNLCEAILLREKYHIIAIDNFVTSTKDNLSAILSNKNISFHKLDIIDREKISKVLKGVKVIIHLASFKIPRYGKRLETLLTNTQGTENILEVAKNNKSKVIFSSTSDVYGKSEQLPFKEDGDSVLGSSNVARWAYATSKIFDEHLCFGYWEQYKVPFVILRLFNVYGPRHSRNWLGGPPSLFIDAILNEQVVEIHGSGQQTRAFTYVDDIVDAIIKSIEQQKAVGQIINLGNTQEITIIELVKLISNLLDKTFRFKKVSYQSFTGAKYQDVVKRYPDISKAKRLLDWRPTTSLKEGLIKTIAWHRQNPI